MQPVLINGRFLMQSLSGVQRYSFELVRALDEILGEGIVDVGELQFGIVVPKAFHGEVPFRHINVIRYGRLVGHPWEQFDLFRYARNNILLNLGSSAPLLHRRSIVTSHDASIFFFPENFGWRYRTFHRFLRPRILRMSMKAITVSEFSRGELARACAVPASKFEVIGDSVEHVLRYSEDSNVLTRRGLTKSGYALIVGNISPNKNIPLAVRSFLTADIEGMKLVIVGGYDKRVFDGLDFENDDRVLFLGRISEEDLSTLYRNARFFLFLSKYEGFGMPPLEAMACGCPVISSNRAAMPEILGEAPLYVDPDNEIDVVSKIRLLCADENLSNSMIKHGLLRSRKYRWNVAAERILTMCKDSCGIKA